MSAPVNLPLPVITDLRYADGTIIVTLDAEPIQTVNAALFKGSPYGTDWLAIGGNTGRFVRVMVDPALLDPTNSYTVALTYDTTTPDWGTETVLVFQQPTLTSVEVRESSATVAWTLPMPTSIEIVTVSIYDTVQEVTIASVSSSATSAAIVSAAPLARGGKYQIMAVGSKGIASGPMVTLDQLLIVTAPTISNVTYAQASGGQFSITASARKEGTPPGKIVARLLSEGKSVMQSPPSDTSVVIALTQALDTAASWQVELAYQASIVTGPCGVAAAIPLQQPRLESGSYDGSFVRLAWSLPEGNPSATGGLATVKRNSDGAIMGSASVNPGVAVDIKPTGVLQPSDSYSASVASLLGTVQGLFGAAQPLVVAAPTLLSVVCNGAQIVVKTQRVAAPAVGTLLTLSDGSNTLCSVPTGAEGGFLAIPQTGTSNLGVAAQACVGSISGPVSITIPVVTATPTLGSIAVSGGNVRGVATTPSGLGLDSTEVWVRLTSDGIAIADAVKAQTDGSFSIQIVSQILTDAQLMAWVEGSAKGVRVTGPCSAAYPVLAVPPQIVEAALTSANGSAPWTLMARWTFPDALSSVSYSAQLQQSGATLGTWTVGGCNFQATVPDFVAGTPMTLTVTPKSNFGTGIGSDPVTFLAVPPEVSAESRADGIVAHWQAPTGAAPSAYRARLLQSVNGAWQTVARSETVTGTSATIPYLLPTSAVADGTFGLAVDIACGAAWTATNAASPLLLQCPVITSIAGTQGATAGEGNCTVTWAWPGGNPPTSPTLTAYAVLLLQEGRETVIKQQAAPAGSTTVTFNPLPPASARLAIRPVAGRMMGPMSAAAPLLFAKPRLCLVEALDAGIRVAFPPVAPPEQGYLMSLLTDQVGIASCWANESPAF
ncbi:MAG: hypothetical protein WC378_19710, partial [Opitutaceae bacterium]